MVELNKARALFLSSSTGKKIANAKQR